MEPINYKILAVILIILIVLVSIGLISSNNKYAEDNKPIVMENVHAVVQDTSLKIYYDLKSSPRAMDDYSGKIICYDSNNKQIHEEPLDCEGMFGTGEGYIDMDAPYEGTVSKVKVEFFDTNDKLVYTTSCSVNFTNESVSSDSDTGSSSSGDSSANSFTSNVLSRYDSDGDGQISASEWDTWCADEGYDSMSNCDSNGDGYCSVSELNTYSHNYGY